MIINENYKNSLFFLNCNKRTIPVYNAILTELKSESLTKKEIKATANSLKTLLKNPSDFSGHRKDGTLFVASCIAMAKKCDRIWSLFNDAEKTKFDDIMRFIAYDVALISDDQNDYKTALGMFGNIGKNWAANYRLQVVAPIIFCYDYFGAANLKNILESFNYENELAILKNNGWNDAVAMWENEGVSSAKKTFASAKEMLAGNNGQDVVPGMRVGNNVFAAGYGKGIAHEYSYQGAKTAKDIYNLMIDCCFSNNTVVSKIDYNYDLEIDAYILDGTTSPYEGATGMMTELSDYDSVCFRSDLLHAYMSYQDVIILICSSLALNIITKKNIKAKIGIGLADFVYKCEHGYHCFAAGKGFDCKPNVKDIEIVHEYKEMFDENVG